MRHRTYILAAFVLLILVGAIYSLYPRPFLSQLVACDSANKEDRFSCYRVAIGDVFGRNPVTFAGYIRENEERIRLALSQENANVSYAVFGTNCHTFYHAAGDFVATFSSEDLKTQLSYGPTVCTNGYTMGLYKRLALKDGYSPQLLKKFYTECKDGAQTQCAHEIGHVLSDKYTYSVLQIIDDISGEKYGITYPEKYTYVTGSVPDLNSAFIECEDILPDETMRAQCLTGIGHNMFLFSEFSPDGVNITAAECDQVSIENKEHCLSFFIFRIGINNAAPYFLEKSYTEGNKVCEDVVASIGRVDLLSHCYLGLGGGIGLFVDSDFDMSDVTDLNLKTSRTELLDYARLCEHSLDGFADKCIAGLLGTRFDMYYALLGIHDERVDSVRSTLDSVFEVVG